MNKQELIHRLNFQQYEPPYNNYQKGYNMALEDLSSWLKYLDEQQAPVNKPEKPVVPRFVAGWYEENKDDFEMSLYNFCVDFHKRKLPYDLYEWFNTLIDKPIETLVMMHKFGYEIEKEEVEK